MLEAGADVQFIPVAGDFVRRESDQREDGLRGAAFHPDESNRLKYIQALLGHESLTTTQIYTHVSIPQLRRIHAKTHPAWRLYRHGNGQSPQPPQPDDGDNELPPD